MRNNLDQDVITIFYVTKIYHLCSDDQKCNLDFDTFVASIMFIKIEDKSIKMLNMTMKI